MGILIYVNLILPSKNQKACHTLQACIYINLYFPSIANFQVNLTLYFVTLIVLVTILLLFNKKMNAVRTSSAILM